MRESATNDGAFDERFMDEALLALSILGTFEAHDWHDERTKNAPPRTPGKARS